MLDRAHRFHGHSSLNFVYKSGKTIRGPLLALKYAPNPRRRYFRVAVVVSRKVHKSAVSRNRMRRRIYAIIRQLRDQITSPYDIVITVFSDAVLEESHQNLEEQIKRQLKAAGIINNSI